MFERILTKRIYALLHVVVLVGWPLTLYAADETFSEALATPVMLVDLLVTLGISVLVGLSSLLSQMKSDYETNGKIDRLWLYVSSKMSCSTVAGVAMYFAADWMKMSRSGTVGMIIVASFSGTLFLEKASSMLIDRFFNKAET